MKEKPILFSTEMVKAILDGRKTQTRRVIKPQPPREPIEFWDKWVVTEKSEDEEEEWGIWYHNCPYGKRGDRLWVRETWGTETKYGGIKPSELPDEIKVYYRTDGEGQSGLDQWRPSIYMPRWGSRLTLEVISIRVERVQGITADDIIAEGLSTDLREHEAVMELRGKWNMLWDSINAKRGYGWKSNPWVWVVKFKRLESEG